MRDAASPAVDDPSVTEPVEALATLETTALGEIASLDPDGSRGLVRRIASLFIADSAHQLALLQEGLRAGDGAAVERSLHSLKSSSSYVGGTALSHAAADLEARAGEGDMSAVAAAAGPLHDLRERTVRELVLRLPGLPA